MNALSVLIVDDDASVRATYAYLARMKSCTAVEAASIDEARRALRSRTFHIVMCDYHLRGAHPHDWNGNAFLREVAASQPGAYRVLVSGDRHPPPDLAGHEFLMKGGNIDQIFALIEKRQKAA